MVARMRSLSVIMFAYNEQENVGPCMLEALSFLEQATDEYELIVVDDGSSDDTAEAARAIATRHPDHVQVLTYRPNRGIGGALKTGFAAATKEWVTCLPADGQVPPQELEKLFSAIESDSSLDLITCHFPDRFKEADNLLRKVLSRGLRVILWAATGVDRKMDGVYLIPREAAQNLPLQSETFFLNLELPIRAIRSGLNPGETTMHIRPRMAGTSKVLNFGRMRRVFSETVRLGWELRGPGGSRGEGK